MAPSTRSKSRNGSNPGNSRIHSSTPSTSAQEPPLSEQPLKNKCEAVLKLLDDINLHFGDFVLAVSYGESTLRGVPSAVAARESLYREDILSKFLGLCLKPPLPPSGGSKRPAGGTKVTEKFIFTKAQETFRSELKNFSENYSLPNDQLANMDYIKTITSSALHRQITLKCPELYALLNALTGAHVLDADHEIEEDDDDDVNGPRKPPVKRHPCFASVFQIASMAYRLNPLRNTLQKVLTIYSHAKHTAKAVMDLFYQGGYLMSYSWVRDQVSSLSAAIREEMILAVRVNPFVMVHDNIRLKYPVRSQRGDNQTVSDNGTAALVIITDKTGRNFKNPDETGPYYRTLRAQRRAGTAPRLCFEDLIKPAQRAVNKTAFIYDILDILATIPELAKLPIWKDAKLKRPIGPQQLPHGPEHRLKQYMLPVTNIDESSYSGNSQFIPFALKALGLDSETERMRLVLEQVIVWIGDQLTAQRCRQLQAFFQECINGNARWDHLIFIFGGLHCMMALSAAILELYRGSNIGATFGADIISLSRTGLQKHSGGEKPEYHTVDEFLQHECEASFRGLFNELTDCHTSESRVEWAKTCTANDLYQLAVRMLTEHASAGALEIDESDDEVRHVIIKRQRELLLFCSLRRAFKYGDIDRIEAILPKLLYFFIGSGHGNYAKEVYELLQLLNHETTPGLRDTILRHGLLEYGPPPQNSSWEQYAKISPVIPVYMEYIEHVESSVTGLSRSHVHKEVKRENDIQALMKEHRKNQIHTVVPGRQAKVADQAKDVQKAGVTAVCNKGYLEEMYEKRAVYFEWSSTLQEQKFIVNPPPAPVSPPNPIDAASPASPVEQDTVVRSSGTVSPLDETGVSPQSDDPVVELLRAGMEGMGLNE
ncbi:hypothetical protein FRC09_014427 [Ceratobasidium sp. 395]|nr:hypothetical protein FRC09_014427 [Ceratobasidium sp. 395]